MQPDLFYQTPLCDRMLRQKLMELQSRFPALALERLGYTVRGRCIWAAHLGSRVNRTLLVGGVHGMEWITTLLLVRFLEELLQCTERAQEFCGFDVTAILPIRGITILPCLNVDGAEIANRYNTSCIINANFSESDLLQWQSNAHGVDLNHNFDAGWALAHALEQAHGITGPGPTRYGGPAPESEPETAALVRFCQTQSATLRAAYAFHTQGEEIYYHYGPHTPARAETMANILAASCGYTVTEPCAFASHAGFKDWFIETLHKPGFTVEAGRGRNPLPLEQLPKIWETLKETLLLTLLL